MWILYVALQILLNYKIGESETHGYFHVFKYHSKIFPYFELEYHSLT